MQPISTNYSSSPSIDIPAVKIEYLKYPSPPRNSKCETDSNSNIVKKSLEILQNQLLEDSKKEGSSERLEKLKNSVKVLIEEYEEYLESVSQETSSEKSSSDPAFESKNGDESPKRRGSISEPNSFQDFEESTLITAKTQQRRKSEVAAKTKFESGSPQTKAVAKKVFSHHFIIPQKSILILGKAEKAKSNLLPQWTCSRDHSSLERLSFPNKISERENDLLQANREREFEEQKKKRVQEKATFEFLRKNKIFTETDLVVYKRTNSISDNEVRNFLENKARLDMALLVMRLENA